MDCLKRSVVLGVVEMVVAVSGVFVSGVEVVVVLVVVVDDGTVLSLNSSSTVVGGIVVTVGSMSAGRGRSSAMIDNRS